MNMRTRSRSLLSFGAALILASAAVLPAHADHPPKGNEPGPSSGSALKSTWTTTSEAVPTVLQGNTWLRHQREDLMPYWETPEALGTPAGNFPTFRGRAGEILPDNTTRGLVALGRRVYGYSLAFMLTGQPKYLAYARAGLDWIETKAADPVHGGYYGVLDADGNPVDPTADKDVSALAAVGLAYGMYFNATRDPDAEEHLLAVRDLLFDKYVDPATNRMKDALTYDLSTEVDTGNNGADLGNYLSVITNIYLFETPLLTDPARRAQFRNDTRVLTQGLISSFRARQAANRWWFWGHTERFGNFNASETSFGHNLKAYDLITNANKMFPDRPWDSLSSGRSTLISRAWDDAASRWNQQPLSFTLGDVEHDSVWWMHDEGDELLATLDFSNGFAFSDQLARSAQTFLDIYVDRDPAYPVRETFTHIERTGTMNDLRKSWSGKSMLHNDEHALVLYLHGRAMEGLPATLSYAFPVDQALTAVAKPYWYDAAGETRVAGALMPGLPGHRVVEVSFNGVDAVPRPPYPAPDDTTAPLTNAEISPPPNAAGWHQTNATVSLTATDDLVGVKEIHALVRERNGAVPDAAFIDPGDSFTLPSFTDEGEYDVTYFAVDQLGNSESPHTMQVRIDTTRPTVSITAPADGGAYLLGQNVPANFTCADSGSGVSSCVGDVPEGTAIDTATVGDHVFTVTGTDNADNVTTSTHAYDVRYDFSGFFSPVDDPPVVNVANAGRTIPVKWRLVDAMGTPVSDSSTFVRLTSVSIDCAGGTDADSVEEYTDGSGLQYLGDGYWQFNWKTPKAYAGQCRTMRLNLADTAGADPSTLAELGRTADFSFR